MRNSRTVIAVAGFYIAAFCAAQAFSAPVPEIQNTVAKTGQSVQPVPAGAPSPDAAPAGPVTQEPGVPAPQCTLKIATDPAGAAVYINDSLKGESPLSISGIAPGDYVLTLRKTGCFGKKASITVNSAPVTELSFVLLQPGFLKVETEPSGAEIWIDDKKEGSTPYETGRIKPGDHTIRVMLAKYAPLERTVTVSKGGRDSLKLVMQYSRAYKEELAMADAARARAHKERVYLGLVSALFVAGAIALVFVEAIGE